MRSDQAWPPCGYQEPQARTNHACEHRLRRGGNQ